MRDLITLVCDGCKRKNYTSTKNKKKTTDMTRGSSSGGRARAFQARGRGFDSRLPLTSTPPGPRALLARSARHAAPMAPDPAPHAAKRRAASAAASGIPAHVAQAAEHFLGKEEVTGSNPVVGSSH